MRYNSLFESLNTSVGSKIDIRRYSLSEMISESYKSLYDCDPNSNLYKLVEAHLDDVRKNPTETDRLSRQLSIIKEISRLTESGELEDKDLLVPKESQDQVNPKKERALDLNEFKDDEDVEEKDDENLLDESVHDEDVEETEDEDLLEDTDLTDEEVEELTKHLKEIRKDKKMKECDSSKAIVKETTKPRKLKRSTISEVKDPSPELQERIMAALADTIYEFGVNPNSLGNMLDDLVYNIATLVPPTDESLKVKRTNERKTYESLNLSEFGKKSSSKAFVKTFKKMQDKLKEGIALTRQESISLYKAANSAMTHLSVELEHNPKFLDTFKESVVLLSADVNRLLGSLKEDKAPSKKTMKSLAKFSEALLCENNDSYEGEYNGAKIKITPEGPAGRACYVDGKLFYMDGGPVDKVLSDLKQNIDHPERMEEAVEDEEDKFVSDGEGEINSEEEEDFDQEYADARVELHKELADEHADTEDPGVQEKLAQDAEEVVNLPGITDEQVAEITGEETEAEEEISAEETPTEDETPEGADDITDDELEELKRHLTEMRKSKKSLSENAKIGDTIVVNKDEDYYKDHGYKFNDQGYVVKKVENYGVFIDGYKYLIPHSDYKIVSSK